MDSSDGRRTALLRLGAYGALLGVVFGTLALTGSIPTPDEAHEWGEQLGAAAVAACVPLFVILNFAIAWPILAGAVGLLFGTAGGTPLALAGVTLASLTQMAVARFLVGDHAGRMLPERVRRLEDFLQRNGAIAVMESRIVPLLPWGLVNHASGLTTLRFRDMALGTVIGGAPKVFGYVALGGSLSNLAATEAKVAVALLVALALAGGLLVRRQLAAAS